MRQALRWLLVAVVVAATALLAAWAALAASFTVSLDLADCHREAARGTVGMVGVGVGGTALVTCLVIAAVTLAIGRRGRAVAVALLAVLAATTPALLVGAQAPACAAASISEDSEGGIVFAAALILVVYSVVAAGACWAAVVLWRRRSPTPRQRASSV